MPVNVKQVTRKKRLTTAQAAKYRRIRQQIKRERPQIDARIRARVAAIRSMDAVLSALKQARQQRGLSLAKMKQLTGMDSSDLSKLENNRRDNFTIDTVARYAKAVGKRVVFLVEDDTAEFATK